MRAVTSADFGVENLMRGGSADGARMRDHGPRAASWAARYGIIRCGLCIPGSGAWMVWSQRYHLACPSAKP